MSSSSLQKIERLVAALKEAQAAADKFKNEPDGGSANLDTVTIELKWWTDLDVNIVSAQSGIKIGPKLGSTMWRNDRFVDFRTYGQASNNTFACEAACKVLVDKGYKANVYYKVD